MAQDYPILGPPSIDLRTFAGILTAAHSPMAASAGDVYAAAVRNGVDPAVLLAIAGHESNYGRAGIAVGRNNPFGSRYYPGMAALPGVRNAGGWAAFATYGGAASYTAALLASPRYAGAGLTARTFPTVYAPTSDGNAPAAYGAAIVASINRWTHGTPATPISAKAAPKAAKVAPKAPAGLAAAGSSTGVSPFLLAALVGGAILLLVIVKR